MPCTALYAGGRGGWLLFARGVVGVGGARGATLLAGGVGRAGSAEDAGDALCAALLDGRYWRSRGAGGDALYATQYAGDC